MDSVATPLAGRGNWNLEREASNQALFLSGSMKCLEEQGQQNWE